MTLSEQLAEHQANLITARAYVIAEIAALDAEMAGIQVAADAIGLDLTEPPLWKSRGRPRRTQMPASAFFAAGG